MIGRRCVSWRHQLGSDVSAVDVGEGVTPETAEVVLSSSRCFTAPIGVTRVNERYTYRASNGTATLQVLAGQTLKSWGSWRVKVWMGS